MTAELILRWSGGELDLMGWNESAHGDFELSALADGTEWGNPQAVRRALRRFLLDGSASVKEYDDNRTLALSLGMRAADGGALAGGEQALALATDGRCEVVWTPPADFSAPAVFVAVSVDLSHKMDDFAENRAERFYNLSLDCLPHVYSDEYVTIPAIAQGSSTPTLIDDCTSLTGWTAANATLSVGAYIAAEQTDDALSWTVTRTGSVDLTTEGYIAARITAYDQATVEVLDSAAAWVSAPRIGSDGSYGVYDATGIGVVSAIRFTWASRFPLAYVVEVNKQATPSSTAKRSHVRTLDVPGSARTPSSLLVESARAGLGTVLLYSGPAYNPDLTRGATGARGGDATTLAGSFDNMASGDSRSFDIAAAEFFEGSHSLWLRASTTVVGTLTCTVSLRTAAGATISTVEVSETEISSATYAMNLLGSADLPGGNLPASSTAVVRVTLAWTSAGAGLLTTDALLAFNRTLGDLTIAEAGTNNKLWQDSATLETDRPAVFVGDGDKRDAVPLSLVSQLPAWPGAHSIEPPVTYFYTGTTGASDTEVSGTFRPAWHTHPTALS